jgi:hypothetical protein
MISIFNSYDELVSHATNNSITNSITISNAKIFINELRYWYVVCERVSEEYYGETHLVYTEDKEYEKFINNETKLEEIDILLEKYEQFLNERNEY